MKKRNSGRGKNSKIQGCGDGEDKDLIKGRRRREGEKEPG